MSGIRRRQQSVPERRQQSFPEVKRPPPPSPEPDPTRNPDPVVPEPTEEQTSAILSKLAKDDVNTYTETVKKLGSKDQDQVDAAKELIRAELENHDVLWSNGLYMPLRCQIDFEEEETAAIEQGLDLRIIDNYGHQLTAALTAVYRPELRGTDELLNAVMHSEQVCVAKLTILIYRLAAWGLEGTGPVDGWSYLCFRYNEFLEMMDSKFSGNVIAGGQYAISQLARGYKNLINSKAYNIPDLSEGNHITFTLLQRTQVFFSPTNPYYTQKYSPDPLVVTVAIMERLWDGRKTSLPEAASGKPRDFHEEVDPSVRDSGGKFDPLLPITGWLDDDARNWDYLRLAMAPRPAHVSDMLKMEKHAFINAIKYSLATLPNFPDFHLIADPMVHNEVHIDGMKYTVDANKFPSQVWTGRFYVTAYPEGSSLLVNSLTYDLREWIAFLLFKVLQQKKPEGLDVAQASQEHYKRSEDQEKYGDIDRQYGMDLSALEPKELIPGLIQRTA